MCGIVGYIGKRPVLPILIEGLKRLEYRGYDSAGVAWIDDKQLVVKKTPGRILELEKKLDGASVMSTIGIAHTRWATHGPPTEVNAHPHTSFHNKFALVHNGIIENYQLLKEKLQKDGYEFRTETDTEVIAYLIEYYCGRSCDFEEAVRKTLADIRGAYGLAILSVDHPDTIIVARKGSPLVVGIGDGEMLVASDVTAILGHTRNVIYLADDEIAILNRDSYVTKTVANQHVAKAVETIEFELESIEKQGFPTFMLKEIYEQPVTLYDAMRGRLWFDEGTAKLGGIEQHQQKLRNAKRIIITSCGTSWHAALIGEYFIEEMARIPVEVEYASEFRYRDPILNQDTVVIAISQSGETIDTLEALREAKRKGCLPVGIVNNVGSSISRETECGVYTRSGIEIGVASTKAFTGQMMILFEIALLLGRMRNVSITEGQRYIQELQKLPNKIYEILNKNPQIEKIAQQYYQAKNFLFLGRGISFPVALEGALKLKEISYIHAEGYPAAEMKHGPIALIDANMPIMMVVPRDNLYQKTLSNIEEVRARHGDIIAIVTEGDNEVRRLVNHIIEIPKTINLLTPFLTSVVLQLFAYHAATMKGLDVDKPRNLAKSVTVE